MITYILLITHLLMDFTFQPAILAAKKQTSFRYLLLHSVIYLVGFLCVCFAFVSGAKAVLAAAVLGVTHFVTDYIKQRLENRYQNSVFRFAAFVFDQVIHIAVVIVVSLCLSLNENVSGLYLLIEKNCSLNQIIAYILLFVIIWDPASVLIKKQFQYMAPGCGFNDETDLKMGNLIGKLERMIVSILLLLGQYASIGLVLTAKSIARFKQLEDKDFAERYLVGTLTSLTIALVASLTVKALL